MEDEDDSILAPTLLRNPVDWLLNLPLRTGNALRQVCLLTNPSPGPDCRAVTDGKGQRYWLQVCEDGVLITMDVYFRGETVGVVYVGWHQGNRTLVLNDINIDERHRGNGLGSQVIRALDEVAVERGAHRITGRIVAKDDDASPNLRRWYRRCGYRVDPVQSEPKPGGTHTVARIEKVCRKD